MYLLAKVWPTNIPPREGELQPVKLLWGWVQYDLGSELQLILVVLLAAALGSYVHAATSFVNFTGTRTIIASWRWWYVLRPFMGMALGLGFYLAIRAGFFSLSAETKSLNIVGFAASAFAVGMFTRQATEKLSHMFDVLFGVPAEYKPQQDKLSDQDGDK
jgi:hypothetical protein